MSLSSHFSLRSLHRLAIGVGAGVLALLLATSAASAATATFTADVPNPGDVAGPTDGLGVLVVDGATIALTTDTPFGGNPGDSVTVFAFSSSGFATGIVLYGSWNGGAPIIIGTRNLSTGAGSRTLNSGNLSGCAAFGGCDYLAITTLNALAGSPGISFDALSINGSFLTAASNPVVAAVPEPATWLLMILGFYAVALRLKYARYGRGDKSHATPAFGAPTFGAVATA